MLSIECDAFCVDPYEPRVKLYNQVIHFSFFSTTLLFLPSVVFMVRTKADEQPGQDLSDEEQQQQQRLLPLKGQDTHKHREKTVKLGWNGGGEQCRRAAARFYGLGSCFPQPPPPPPPPPGPSSFLRCTVVYT